MKRINQKNHIGTRATRYILAKMDRDWRLEECVQPLSYEIFQS